MLAKMAKIGVVPGQPFDIPSLDPAVQTALKDCPRRSPSHRSQQKLVGAMVNGWIMTKASELWHELHEAGGRGSLWLARKPRKRRDLSVYLGRQQRPHALGHQQIYGDFRQGENTAGRWLLVDHDVRVDQGWWFVPNALNKFTVSERDNPKPSADGSLTLYFQNESPGNAAEANWLPAPKGDFIPMLRMYWPKETSPSILNGTWKPPSVERTA